MTKKLHESDVAFIQALAELLRDNDLSEIEVERDFGEADRLKVRVSRVGPSAAFQVAVPQADPGPGPAVSAPTAGRASTTAGPPDTDDPANHPGAVNSPMVGTVYMQTEPGSAPFVSVGAEVNEGDTVLIIEAMKTMNHIPAPRSGSVKRILVGDGDPVEFGAPLMIIE